MLGRAYPLAFRATTKRPRPGETTQGQPHPQALQSALPRAGIGPLPPDASGVGRLDQMRGWRGGRRLPGRGMPPPFRDSPLDPGDTPSPWRGVATGDVLNCPIGGLFRTHPTEGLEPGESRAPSGRCSRPVGGSSGGLSRRTAPGSRWDPPATCPPSGTPPGAPHPALACGRWPGPQWGSGPGTCR